MTTKSEPTKFKHHLKFSPPLHEDNFLSIEKWRIIFFRLSFFGKSKTTGLNYGDLSKRILVGENQFIITGSQTGDLSNLDGSQYARVAKCDFKKLSIECSGTIAPTHNSHIHYLLYKTCPQINFIFQVQNQGIWEYLIQNSTNFLEDSFTKDFEAAELSIGNLIHESPSGVIALKKIPHQVFSFGATAEIAGRLLLTNLKESKK